MAPFDLPWIRTAQSCWETKELDCELIATFGSLLTMDRSVDTESPNRSSSTSREGSRLSLSSSEARTM